MNSNDRDNNYNILYDKRNIDNLLLFRHNKLYKKQVQMINLLLGVQVWLYGFFDKKRHSFET